MGGRTVAVLLGIGLGIAGPLLGAAAPARASATQESIFQDDDLLLSSTPEVADAALADMHDLGADRIRLSVIWKNFAPSAGDVQQPAFDASDPAAYPTTQFDNLDHVVRVARRLGIEVLLDVRGGAPRWAMPARIPRRFAGRDGYLPSPGDFREFAAMMGRRYDGTYTDENQGRAVLPRVSAWSVWNEPNWSGHLQPQTERDPKTRRLVAVSPRQYRRLYRAAVSALQATGHGADTILLGETAPIGNTKPGELSHIKPIEFLRDLFCLDSKLKPLAKLAYRRAGCDFASRGALPATGYAHHPYSVTSAPGQPSADPGFATLADGDRLKAVLDAAAAAGRIPAGLPLWYTEFGYQTTPPDPFRGVSLDQQAQWLVDAEQLTWSDPRVAGMTQFLLRDDEPRNEYGDHDPRRWATYQTGLEFDDGRQKPAYASYRLPLRVTPGPTPEAAVSLWGMVRPGTNGVEQRIRIEFRPDGEADWRTLSERSVTDPHGYWSEEIAPAGAGAYRFEWLQPTRQPVTGLPGPVVAEPSADVPAGVG